MSAASKYNRLSKDDAVTLFVDHQSGLIPLVKDYPPGEFKYNVLALANVAEFFKLPTILTTSFEQVPNGPLVPELKEMFPEAPLIPRPGQMNAWDNEDFVNAVQAADRAPTAHDCRRGHRRVCRLPHALGVGGRLRRVCRHGCVRDLQCSGPSGSLDTADKCRSAVVELVRCGLRATT